MLSPYLKRIAIDVFLFIALGLGIFYIYKVFLDFLISLFHFDMGGNLSTVNISSLAYCFQRVTYIFLPLVMLTVINRFSKLKLFKVLFFIIGVCYLLGNSWIIYYAIDNPAINLIYGSIPKWFWSGDIEAIARASWESLVLYQYERAMVFNYLIWDSYDLFGVLFSTVQGILYIQLSLILDTSRGRVLRKMILIAVLTILLPFIYNICVRKIWIVSGTWLNKNILLFFETLFMMVALNLAATSRNFWHDVLW